MNLAKLFETQRELGKVGLFNYRGPDRFEKLVLALLVELGECANEWRGFKFWSQNQVPRTYSDEVCKDCAGYGRIENINIPLGSEPVEIDCPKCNGHGHIEKNPLLEEYVDGLHFLLEICLEIAEELQIDVSDYFEEIISNVKDEGFKCKTITHQFNSIYYFVSVVGFDYEDTKLFAYYYHLGEMLGFIWEQIEAAYYAKNQINHERQNNGY